MKISSPYFSPALPGGRMNPLKSFLICALVSAPGTLVGQFASNPTRWLGGNGNFFETAKWSNGRPGGLVVGGINFTLTQFTGPYYSHNPITIDYGAATLNPQFSTIYYLTGAPEERYSQFSYVGGLDMKGLRIGVDGTGSLSMTNGFSLDCWELYLGMNPGSSGTFTTGGAVVSGGTLNFKTTGDTYVGYQGVGRMTLQGGSKGDYCDNFFKSVLSSGRVLLSRWYTSIGEMQGADGRLTVTGAGSNLTYKTSYFGPGWQGNAIGFFVGARGKGGMDIMGGGSVLSKAARIGAFDGSEGQVHVSGANSRWDVDSQIYIGESGFGSLTISNGGLVRSAYGEFRGTVIDPEDPESVAGDFGSLGLRLGSEGNVVVNGQSSRWDHNANLVIGHSGKASLSIEDQGSVVSKPRVVFPSKLYDAGSGSRVGSLYAEEISATIGLHAGADGSVKIQNGRWYNGASLVIGDQGIGKLTLAAGGVADVGGDGIIHLGRTGGGELIFGGANNVAPGSLGGHTVKGGAGASTVRFQHNSTNFTFPHNFEGVQDLESTGPGRTTLTGGVRQADVIKATAGVLEIRNNPHFTTANFLRAESGGEIVISGGIVSTPNVQFARTNLGANGVGTVSVNNGGRLESSFQIGASLTSGARGILKVSDPGSIIRVQGLPLNIGKAGLGELFVAAGGTVINDDPAFITTAQLGDQPTSIGRADIRDPGSVWRVGNLTIGSFGEGSVTVGNSGQLLTASAVLAAGEGSSGSVTAASSGSWNNTANRLIVGDAGIGNLTLAGGTVRVGPNGDGTLTLGAQATGEGYLRMGSGGSPGVLNAAKVERGEEGYGRVIFKHNIGYSFAPLLDGVGVESTGGCTGATGLTASSNLTQLQLINGKIVISSGAKIRATSIDVGYIGNSGSTPSGTPPILAIENNGSELTCDRDVHVGEELSNAEIQLTNGGVLEVGRGGGKVILAGPTSAGGGISFGNGSFSHPGTLRAAAIEGRGTNTSSKVTFNFGSRHVFSPALTGKLSVYCTGDGITVFSDAKRHTGGTFINAGSLIVNGSITDSSGVYVSGTLGGTGYVKGPIQLNSAGVIAPGDQGIGTLQTRNLSIPSGGLLKYQIGAGLATDHIRMSSLSSGYDSSTLETGGTGPITFNFQITGAIQTGAYNLISRAEPFPIVFMNRLQFTTVGRTGVQGVFRSTYVFSAFPANRHYRLEFNMTSTGQSDYDIWSGQNGLNPATTGLPDADPDRDGVSNMLEFILRSSPTSGKQESLPVASVTPNGSLYFSFTKRFGSESLFTTTVQYSTNFHDWTDCLPAMVSTATFNGLFTFVRATIPPDPERSQIFARLVVTAAVP